MNDITSKLDEFTKECFEYFLKPRIIGDGGGVKFIEFDEVSIGKTNEILNNSDTCIAMGDGDGSIAREILAGILAGCVSLTPTGVNALVELMKEEAKTLQKLTLKSSKASEPLEKFQKNSKVKGFINTINDNIIYNEKITNIIINGDNVHDRFSSEKKYAHK